MKKQSRLKHSLRRIFKAELDEYLWADRKSLQDSMVIHGIRPDTLEIPDGKLRIRFNYHWDWRDRDPGDKSKHRSDFPEQAAAVELLDWLKVGEDGYGVYFDQDQLIDIVDIHISKPSVKGLTKKRQPKRRRYVGIIVWHEIPDD